MITAGIRFFRNFIEVLVCIAYENVYFIFFPVQCNK